MARVFVKISEEKFRQKIEEAEDKYNEWAWYFSCDTIRKDLLKVNFDLENLERAPGSFGPQRLMGFKTLKNGFTFLGVCAGGDWEEPVFFIIYWNGKSLRGYIPTQGNLWNTDTHMAYGNYSIDESENDNIDTRNKNKRNDLLNNNYNEDLIEQDIVNRIKESK